MRLTVDGKSQTQPFKVVPDPRLKISAEDLKKQFDLMQQILGKVTEVHDAVRQMRDIRLQMAALDKRLKEEKDPNAKAVADAGKDLDKKMTTVEEALIQTKSKSGQDVLNYPIRLNNLLVALGGVVSSADAAPTTQYYEMYGDLSKQADEQLAKWKEIVKTDLAAYNKLAQEKAIPAIGLPSCNRALRPTISGCPTLLAPCARGWDFDVSVSGSRTHARGYVQIDPILAIPPLMYAR